MPWAGSATMTEPIPARTAQPPDDDAPGRFFVAGTLAARRDKVSVSATLAANEELERRRLRGEPVLPLAFGESGLPVHPRLTAALAEAAGRGAYGPVAGTLRLRAAAAGYWSRRSLPTTPDAVVTGPGSKALLFAAMLALRTGVAVPQPSWVSYAAQATLCGVTPHFVPTVAGEGGVCDPDALEAAVRSRRHSECPIGAVLVTLPDNPTGRLASPDAIRALCAAAERNGLLIISDEIYRDLVHDPSLPFLSPAQVAPERTVVTTSLSKSFSAGGWRIGVARMPDGPCGVALRSKLLGIASEIWSAAPGPMQAAAAVALDEPAELVAYVNASRALHAAVCHEAARRCAAAGLEVAPPQAAFYLYPDFAPWRDLLRTRFGIQTGTDLAALLLDRYGAGTLPASAFGESPSCLRLRLATSQLYGDTDEQREQALAAADPLQLPWISAALTRFEEILTDLGGLGDLAA
jgi:aspartate aminotransferase